MKIPTFFKKKKTNIVIQINKKRRNSIIRTFKIAKPGDTVTFLANEGRMVFKIIK